MTRSPGFAPLVHVGFHKTGSTWLQEGLFQHERHGFATVDGKHPANFGWRFIYGGPRGLRSLFSFSPEAVRKECLDTWSEENTLVISNEDFIGHMFNGGVLAREQARNIASSLPEARILLVVRRQKDLIRSAYTDFLEGGGACSIDEFLRRENDNQIPLFSLEYAKFHYYINMYREMFGPDNVLTLPYEMARHDPRRFIQSIVDFSGGRPISTEEMEEVCGSKANVTDQRRGALQVMFPAINLLGKKTNNNARVALGWPSLRRYSVYYGARILSSGIAKKRMDRLSERIDAIVGNEFVETNREMKRVIGWEPADYEYEM